MLEITLPNGSILEVESGTTGIEVAKKISNSLAKKVLTGTLNGNTIELNDPITENGELKLFTWDDSEGKNAFWHSSAHVLAQAILFFHPNAKLTIGPAIETGFYYDVDLGEEVIHEKDFPAIEKKMLEFAKEKALLEKKAFLKKKL